MTLRQLSIVFIVLVSIVGVGIATGFFNRGATAPGGAPASAGTPAVATGGVAPAAPAQPATPVPAPIRVYDGETAGVHAEIVLEMSGGNTAGAPGGPFVRYRGSEQAEFVVQPGNRFNIRLSSIGWTLAGTLDPATGVLIGEIADFGRREFYSHFRGQLTRDTDGRLVVQGGFCAAAQPGGPMADRIRNVGGRVWGPLDVPMPAGLAERASNLCGPDSPAAIAAGPAIREDTIENLRRNGG